MSGKIDNGDLSPLSNEELVASAQAGDKEALSALVVRMLPLAYAYASRLSESSFFREDLMQEGMFGLLSAIRTYSPGKNASFKTYAGVCIKNTMLSAIKKFNRTQDLPLSENESFYSVELSPEEAVISKESSKMLRIFIEKELSPFEKKVFFLYINGRNYREIADKLSSKEKTIDNALYRIRRKLQKFA